MAQTFQASSTEMIDPTGTFPSQDTSIPVIIPVTIKSPNQAGAETTMFINVLTHEHIAQITLFVSEEERKGYEVFENVMNIINTKLKSTHTNISRMNSTTDQTDLSRLYASIETDINECNAIIHNSSLNTDEKLEIQRIINNLYKLANNSLEKAMVRIEPTHLIQDNEEYGLSDSSDEWRAHNKLLKNLKARANELFNEHKRIGNQDEKLEILNLLKLLD